MNDLQILNTQQIEKYDVLENERNEQIKNYGISLQRRVMTNWYIRVVRRVRRYGFRRWHDAIVHQRVTSNNILRNTLRRMMSSKKRCFEAWKLDSQNSRQHRQIVDELTFDNALLTVRVKCRCVDSTVRK